MVLSKMPFFLTVFSGFNRCVVSDTWGPRRSHSVSCLYGTWQLPTYVASDPTSWLRRIPATAPNFEDESADDRD
jgi:hypothetical protein